MTSLKAHSRQDLSAGSIPTLLEEENHYTPRLAVNGNGNDKALDTRKFSDSNVPSTTAYTNLVHSQKHTKASRRSSLGLGLLSGKSDSNKSGKRRSSIAVVFLGRRSSKVCSKLFQKIRLERFAFMRFRNFTVQRTGSRES